MLISNSIFIACAAPEVWEVTTDIDRWSDWAPTVQTARRLDKQRFGLGSQASIKQPMQSRAVWTVTAFEKGRFFAWETSGKAFRMCASHKITSDNGGATCSLKVKLNGPVAKIFAVFLAPFIWLALKQENRGLKRWCEGGRQPNPCTTNQPLTPSSTEKKQISESAQPKEG